MTALTAVLGALLAFGFATPQNSPSPEELWTAPAGVRGLTNPVASSPDALKRGRNLFVQHCVICHGDKGHGDGPSAKTHARRAKPPEDLTLPALQRRLTDGEIFWKLTNGWRRNGQIIMPAFEGDIPSPEDRWKLVLHVRSLAAPAP